MTLSGLIYPDPEKRTNVSLDVLDEFIRLDKDGEVLTQVSHKYTHDQAESLLMNAGLHILRRVETGHAGLSLVMADKPL